MTKNDLPALFCARMKKMLGDEYEAFEASYGKEPKPSLRFNPLKDDPESLFEVFTASGLKSEGRVEWFKDGIFCDADGDSRPGKNPLHEQGAYYIQEASAMIPAAICPPGEGEKVLDLCAAPGGKTTQIAGHLMGTGLLVSNEISRERAAVLSRNVERMGIRNCIVTNETPENIAGAFPCFFDKVFVDAPCSGEGMFRKEPDALSMWSAENVALCARRQSDILNQAAKTLKPGGKLIYSTCTFAPEENEAQIYRFLLSHPEFEAIPTEDPDVLRCIENGLLSKASADYIGITTDGNDCPEEIDRDIALETENGVRLLPHRADGEGHFAIILRKNGGETVCTHKKPAKNKNGVKGKSALDSAVPAADKFLHEMNIGVGGAPVLFGNTLYYLPAGIEKETLDGLRVLRAGLCAGEMNGSRFEPSHSLALSLSAEEAGAAKSYALRNADETAKWLHGEALPCPPECSGWYVVTSQGYPIGFGKASGGQMKNHYPKGLRK